MKKKHLKFFYAIESNRALQLTNVDHNDTIEIFANEIDHFFQ